MDQRERDEPFMRMAIEEADRALQEGEDVPIGAVVVKGEEVLARAHNRREAWSDPTAHAEIVVLREAAQRLGRWRLTGATLYVTVEPCAMCAGALILARIDRLVYGCADPKAGACGSVFSLLSDSHVNHRVEVSRGVLEKECQRPLHEFFQWRRRHEPATSLAERCESG